MLASVGGKGHRRRQRMFRIRAACRGLLVQLLHLPNSEHQHPGSDNWSQPTHRQRVNHHLDPGLTNMESPGCLVVLFISICHRDTGPTSILYAAAAGTADDNAYTSWNHWTSTRYAAISASHSMKAPTTTQHANVYVDARHARHTQVRQINMMQRGR